MWCLSPFGKNTCSLYYYLILYRAVCQENVFMYRALWMHLWFRLRLWADCNAKTAQCVRFHCADHWNQSMQSILIFIMLQRYCCPLLSSEDHVSVNLVYLVDTFIWHDAIIWNVRIFDAGGYYINGSVHFFFFTVYLIKHWKIIHVFSLSLKYI